MAPPQQDRTGLPCYDPVADEVSKVTWECLPATCPRHNPNCDGTSTAWVAANKVCDETVNYGISHNACQKGFVNTDPILTEEQKLRKRLRDDAILSLKDGALPSRLL